MALRVRNHVRRNGNRVISSPSRGAIFAPACNTSIACCVLHTSGVYYIPLQIICTLFRLHQLNVYNVHVTPIVALGYNFIPNTVQMSARIYFTIVSQFLVIINTTLPLNEETYNTQL